MSKGYRLYEGRAYPDPEGFTIDPRRTWREDPLLQIKPWHPFMLWKFLIYLAVWDWDGVKVRRGNEIMVLERGQLFYSMRYLAEAAGWKKDKVSLELKRWERDGRITLEPRHNGTLITIENYDPYQDIEWYRGAPSSGRDLDTPRKRRHETRQKTRQGEVPTEPDVRHGLAPVGRHETRQFTRRRRDADATNNKSVNSVNTRALTRQTPTAPPPATWNGIRNLRDCGVWKLAPDHERERQLLEAANAEPAPPELEDWARRQCELVGLPYPYDMDQHHLEDQERTDDADPETELRQKLAALQNSRR